MTDVKRFSGEYRFLSNFHPSKVVLDGDEYPSVENAYQAAKVAEIFRPRFFHVTSATAKRLGRIYKSRADWEDVKVDIMRDLLIQKFAPGSELAARLCAIDGWIEEGNTWGDQFWGVCNGHGNNILGRLLMSIRDVLLVTRLDQTGVHPISGAV